MKTSAEPAELLPAFVVTTTCTVPLAPAGAVAAIAPSDLTVNEAAAAPKRTPVASVKPEPEIVTAVPPATGPEEGERPLTTGAGCAAQAPDTGAAAASAASTRNRRTF